MSDTSEKSQRELLLLVEDDEQNRDMLTRRLQRSGYRVASANDGELAFSETKNLTPDLILMDVSLPKLNGYQATRRIKSDPEVSHIPIVILTAHAMDVDEQKARAAGAEEFATKPVNFEELLLIIERLLKPPPEG